MVGISFAEIFDAEVVNGEGERGSTSGMAPETRCEAQRFISIGSEVLLELFVGQDAGFFHGRKKKYQQQIQAG